MSDVMQFFIIIFVNVYAVSVGALHGPGPDRVGGGICPGGRHTHMFFV